MIAQELNNYFSSVYISDNRVIPQFPPIAIATEITSIHFDVFLVMKVLTSSCSTYGVPNVYFTNNACKYVYLLSLLFERSMIEGYISILPLFIQRT